MRWIGLTGIVSIAVLRCLIVFLPQLVFDSDPVGDSAPAALGMGGSLLLDALLILACLVALFGEWRSAAKGGRGLDPLLLLFALLPLPIVLWHGSNDAGNLWRGSTWLAAAIACVTVAHLARERPMRMAITAALIAVIVPLLARGATQMTYEHDAMVETYHAHKAEFLRWHGWQPDSPAVRIYERRLMHREPIGWFPSTNIFGSLAGCAAVMFAGLALVAWRAKMQSGWWFLMLLLAIACAAALLTTTSMGALLASVGGLWVLLIVIWLLTRAPPHRTALLAPLLVLLMFGAIAGVIVRGALLPEGFAHDRSLLFRWHYLQAAMGIARDHPLAGAGPDGFQEAYTQHRVPRNPEEVQSAHSMFVDWIATLGILGGAWAAMVIVLAAQTGTNATGGTHPTGGTGVSPVRRPTVLGTRPGETPGPPSTHAMKRLVPAVAALAFIPAIIIEWPALGGIDLFVRGLGLAGYIVVALLMIVLLDRCDERGLRGITAAAALVLLIHGQIEMTFFQHGSVVWAMCMVGLLGDARPARSPMLTRVCGVLVSLGLLLTGGWLLLRGAFPALAQEQAMDEAARLLAPVREHRDDIHVMLRQRPLAADKLVEAYNLWPINDRPLNAAADQLMFATPKSDQPPPLGLLLRARDIIDRAVADHHRPSSIVLAMNVHAALAGATDDAEEWSRAIALGQRMTQIDPRGVNTWLRLGEVLWLAGERSEAARAYRTALTNSDNFALDDQKQLSAAERARVQARIDDAERVSPPNPG